MVSNAAYTPRSGSTQRDVPVKPVWPNARGDSRVPQDDVVNIVDSKKPGDKVSVELLRKNQKRTVTVTLGNRPQNLGSGGSETQPQLPLIP